MIWQIKTGKIKLSKANHKVFNKGVWEGAIQWDFFFFRGSFTWAKEKYLIILFLGQCIYYWYINKVLLNVLHSGNATWKMKTLFLSASLELLLDGALTADAPTTFISLKKCLRVPVWPELDCLWHWAPSPFNFNSKSVSAREKPANLCRPARREDFLVLPHFTHHAFIGSNSLRPPCVRWHMVGTV